VAQAFSPAALIFSQLLPLATGKEQAGGLLHTESEALASVVAQVSDLRSFHRKQ
jgi:hypothetical protein